MSPTELPRTAPLLVLTMHGFGVETLRRLDADPQWPSASVVVGVIGRRPGWARAWAARVRLWWRGPKHPHAWRAEGALAGHDAARWLASRNYRCHWVATDDDVRRLRTAVAPDLTLTITSRIIFSEQTLAAGRGDWLNVHPGLLPDYAGASPVPYMFIDRRAGCTIHRMAVGVDAGAIVDTAALAGDLGADGGALLYERLPGLAAQRIVAVLEQWRAGRLQSHEQDPLTLAHRSQAQLRHDRRLRWTMPPESLVRWVRALMPFAPAHLIDVRGCRRDVHAAEVDAASTAPPGTVLHNRGHRIRVACMSGSVWLVCASPPAAREGDVLVDHPC